MDIMVRAIRLRWHAIKEIGSSISASHLYLAKNDIYHQNLRSEPQNWQRIDQNNKY